MSFVPSYLTITGLDPDFCYSLKQAALIFNLSREYFRKKFRHHPDCYCFVEQKPGKRRYVSYRIPGQLLIELRDHAKGIQ